MARLALRLLPFDVPGREDHDAVERQRRQAVDEASELDDAIDARHPGAPRPRLDLDDDAAALARRGERLRRPAGAIGGVDREPQPGTLEQRREPAHLRLADEWIRDEEVVEARLDHRLGLAELGHGQTIRTVGELTLRDLARLVRLRVRQLSRVRRRDPRRHPGQVALEAADLHEGDGRVEIADEAHRPLAVKVVPDALRLRRWPRAARSCRRRRGRSSLTIVDDRQPRYPGQTPARPRDPRARPCDCDCH